MRTEEKERKQLGKGHGDEGKNKCTEIKTPTITNERTCLKDTRIGVLFTYLS